MYYPVKVQEATSNTFINYTFRDHIQDTFQGPYLKVNFVKKKITRGI